MPHSPRRRRPESLRTRGVAAFGAAVAAVLLAASGCGDGSPEIHAPELSAADAQVCRDFVADLPDTMAGQKSVAVSGDKEYGAAWGDPAIVLTCGVDPPSDFTDTSTCIAVDDAGWYVPDSVFEAMFNGDESVDVATTEMNYRPRIHVEIPGKYRPDGFTNTTGALSKLIARDLRRVGDCI